MGADKAAAAAEEILQRLRTDYVDLLLIHWPGASKVPVTSPRNAELRLETWRVRTPPPGGGGGFRTYEQSARVCAG